MTVNAMCNKKCGKSLQSSLSNSSNNNIKSPTEFIWHKLSTTAQQNQEGQDFYF